MKKILIALLLIFFQLSAEAASNMSCTYNALTVINKEFKPGFLSTADKKVIAKILSEKQDPKKAFDIYFAARTKNLDPKIKELVEDVKEFAVIIDRPPMKDREYFWAFFNHTTESILVDVPTSLKDSVLIYAFLIHELEHAIQFYSTKDIFPYHDIGFGEFKRLFPDKARKYMGLTERGSMLAKYEFLSSIPFSVRQKIIKEVKNKRLTPELTRRDRKYFISILSAADLPQALATRKMMKASGYGRLLETPLERLESIITFFNRSAQLMAATLGTCLILDRTNQESSFYQNICQDSLSL